MFEKISNAAEKLATNVSESRRGFLGRLGRAALGVAGAVGSLLALPTEAEAWSPPPGNYCEVVYRYPAGFVTTGYCVNQPKCTSYFSPNCRAGTYHLARFSICRTRVTSELYC